MKRLSKIIILGTVAMSLFGCGEDREHKPLPKLEVLSKAEISENKEYLYVASTGEVSRTTSLGRPYFQGQEQIVKLEFTEHELIAYAIDKEERFQGNKTNKKIVFQIPIEHIDYRERTDSFGEGTNVEEKNEFVDWKDRKFFRARPEKFKFTSVGTLPTEWGDIFGGVKCQKEKRQSDLEFSVKKDAINIVIRKDFTSNYFCESGVNELTDLAGSQETHYSLVPLESVITKSYKAKDYPREWERTFGFFDSKEIFLDSSNNPTQAGEKFFMHRWNPERKVVTYHLDPRLNKPENSVLKGATLKAFERLNVALKEAGAKLRLETVDGASDFKPGDIRYSSIVLVEDPVGAGLLGYGPSVVNPRTGEIVQARTVMYPGIMRKIIRRAYDELVEIEESEEGDAGAESLMKADFLKERLAQEASTFKSPEWRSVKGDLAEAVARGGEVSEEASFGGVDSSLGQVAAHDIVAARELVEENFFERVLKPFRSLFYEQKITDENYRSIENGEIGSFSKLELELESSNPIEFFSRNNMLPASEVNVFTDITDQNLKDKVLNIGKKQAWDKLEESQRETIVDLVMPYVWIPTLIHEVGHNLGLRHNFGGSEDKENFYTVEELAAKGVESTWGAPYSSMMEYTKSEITSLRVPGKYDVAALRYAYAGKVELADGSLVNAPASVPGNLKKFEYCSDESVALNPGCNRFDEGTNLVEIVDSIIDSYYKRYKTGYFRNGRSNFSRYDDLRYASRVNSQFRSLRLAYERLMDIMVDFNISIEEAEGIEWLKEYSTAAKNAANFLKNVVAEPDYSCVVYKDGKFDSIIRFSEISGFEAKTCSDVSLRAGYTVEGELGRSLLSRKFRDNPNIYLDQIDVRGVWFDKMLAMKFLTSRTLGMFSFDKNTLSYLDHPVIGGEIGNFVKNIALGDMVSNVQITMNDGTTFKTDYRHSFATGYEMPKPLHPYINLALGLPNRKTDLAPSLVKVARLGVLKGMRSPGASDFYKGLRVYSNSQMVEGSKGSKTYEFLEDVYFYNDRNDLAANLFEQIEIFQKLYPQFERQSLIDVYLAMVNERDIPEGTDERVIEAGSDKLYTYLTGAAPSESYYFRMLDSM